MERLKLTIDSTPVEVDPGSTVLDAAKKAGVHIPTLCYHPELKLEGSCRICVVEIEGLKNLAASCVYPAANGMVVRTNSEVVRKTRKSIVELLLANHPEDCLVCPRHGTCELQDLSHQLNVRKVRFKGKKREFALDESSIAVVRDPNKCILCGRCIRICENTQKVSAIGLAGRGSRAVVTTPFNRGLAEGPCVACGQCIKVCPVAALRERDASEQVWKALGNSTLHTVVQVAPAVRAALGEEFGLRPGALVTEKMVAALRKLGFNRVFDTQFGADLTVVEEGHELLHRLEKNENLPQITSCSPGWVKYAEHFFPEMLNLVSTCKSPQQMFGALVKTYYAEKFGIAARDIFHVAVMPCTAKKFEASREEMGRDGLQDVDAVITTRELAFMIKEAGIDFANLPDSEFDLPLGMSSGAGTIFGVTGGVTEAVLRSVYEIKTGKELEEVEFQAVRGFGGVREAQIPLNGMTLRVAIVNSLGQAEKILNKIKAGEASYHFIEIMGCLGGCIGGGGQPFSKDPDIKQKRASALYRQDHLKRVRKSHENPAIKELYRSFLGEPNGDKAHDLLHTHYRARPRY
ncbi:MAG: NADP-reducing hydrogenase subunit HndC [Firmicutes bacterium]|nr:NADP-reducing hydrogenase subunit HndC [Bacillota bacterium]